MNDPTQPPPAPRLTPPTLVQQVHHEPIAPARNTLGTTAFVFSLLGVTILPGIGGLVGLILGIVAVRREPRGLAIAAIVISVASSCLIVPILLMVGVTLPALGRARMMATQVKTQISAQQMQVQVLQFRSMNGRSPKDLAELKTLGQIPTDSWDTELRYVVVEGASGSDFEIYSAGPDTTWDTLDDILLYSSQLESTTGNGFPPTSPVFGGTGTKGSGDPGMPSEPDGADDSSDSDDVGKPGGE